MFNTNRNYINEAQRLKRDKPEVFEQIKSGEKTITEVKKEEKKEVLKESKLFESQKMPEGIYDLIYCDPPWKYDFAETDNRKIENQYPTMTVDEICKMERYTGLLIILLGMCILVVLVWGCRNGWQTIKNNSIIGKKGVRNSFHHSPFWSVEIMKSY